MVKKSTAWTTLIYGLLISGLGYFAYVHTGSKMSLYSGCGFGALLVISSVLMFYKIQFGSYAALLWTFILTATFAVRYSITHKGMIAILAVLSGGMLLYLLARAVPWKK